jgi:hypothetical protein
MVKGVMVLIKGGWIGTLYKLLGNAKSTRCKNIVVHEFNSNSTRLELDSNRIRLNLTQLRIS